MPNEGRLEGRLGSDCAVIGTSDARRRRSHGSSERTEICWRMSAGAQNYQFAKQLIPVTTNGARNRLDPGTWMMSWARTDRRIRSRIASAARTIDFQPKGHTP